MIKRLVTDCDGVITDGGFFYSEEGKVYKKFGPHDADGIKMLRAEGIEVFAISGDKRGFPITKKRCDDMGVDLKLVTEAERLAFINNTHGFKGTAFVGDGFYDAPVLEAVERGYAPSDGTERARILADVVTKAGGGRGVLLEVAIDILEYNNK